MRNIRKRITYWPYWYGGLMIMGITGTVMALHPEYRFDGLLRLQFTETEKDFTAFAGTARLQNLKSNTRLDYLFIAAYTALFLSSLCAMAKRMELPIHWAAVTLCLLPGFFDIIENTALLALLHTTGANDSYTVFYWAVRLKWALVIPWVLVIAVLVSYQTVIAADKLHLKIKPIK